VRRLPALCLSALLLTVVALGTGCGEGGVGGGATVAVYVAAPLCKEALGALQKAGGEADDLKVEALCLAPVESGGGVDLAVAGVNARRASEDSSSVAYLDTPGRGAKFSQSIVEAANIAWLKTSSGATAIRRVLKALEERGSSSPRDAARGLDQIP
jgi:hypothetical protein